MHIGTKIKFARIAKKLSQQELANKIGKGRPLVSHVEQTGKVNPGTLGKIASALGKSVEELESIEYAVTGKRKKVTIEDRQEEEITLLKGKIKTLQELVDSQKEVIKMLRQQFSKKKKTLR